MEQLKPKRQASNFFLKTVFLLLIIPGLAAFTAAMLGWFYAAPFALYYAAALIYLLHLKYKHALHQPQPRDLQIIPLIILLFSAIFVFFSTPSVFSGRDEGSLSEAAVRLSQNHQLPFETQLSKTFAPLGAPGVKALNFPGFYYERDGQLVTQFPLPYIALLALFYGLFGFVGFQILNWLLLSLFLSAFYLSARWLLSPRSSWFALTIALSSFAFAWFAKFTLSENLMLVLVWVLVLETLLLSKKPSADIFSYYVFTAILLIFTRIEGFVIFLASLLCLLFYQASRDFLRHTSWKKTSLPLFVLLTLGALNFYADFYFFKEIGKVILGWWHDAQNSNFPSTLASTKKEPLQLSKILWNYGMLPIFLAALFGILISFIQKKLRYFIPLIVIAPTLFYFYDPHITLDHPWMLRRYVFALLPAAIFYSAVLAHRLRRDLKERYPWPSQLLPLALLAFLLAFNLPAFGRLAFFTPNFGLLQGIKSLDSQLDKRDLLLVDRLATGNPFLLPTGLLNYHFNKNAVYFFNPQDLAKLDLTPYAKVYLMTSAKNPALLPQDFQQTFKPTKLDYSLNYSSLIRQADPNALPLIGTTQAYGQLYLLEK